MEAKIKILLDLYGTYYPKLVDTEVLLKALKKLPASMQLEPKFTRAGPRMPPMEVAMNVSERIKELERDQQVLSVRIDAIKDELKATPGGIDAFKKCEWKRYGERN